MKTSTIFKTVIATILLSLFHCIFNLIVGIPETTPQFIWGVASNFLVITLLIVYIQHSSLSLIRTGLAVFAIYFLIGQFNLLVEAWIFNVTDRHETSIELLRGLLITLLIVPFLLYLFKNFTKPSTIHFKHRSWFSWAWRIITADIFYLLIYLTAGFILTIVYPTQLQFYEGKLPSFPVMINTQLFLRGLIFAGISILIMRTVQLPFWSRAIFTGLVFAILGGIAPLMIPSELMPLNVRWGHGIEVGLSNFILGLVFGKLLGQPALHNINIRGSR